MASNKESGLMGKVLGDKLSNSRMSAHSVPYVQMNKQRTIYWSTCDKALFWCATLLLFLGISALFLILATQQDTFLDIETLEDGEVPSAHLAWDELIFTQLWGFSSCLQFKDKHHPRSVECRYADKPSFWSIHGIWPTQEGSEGPNFCSKVKFDISLLDSIRPQLDEYWYEIDNTKQGNYFWSHEWVKHGSCAKELSEFGTELLYFGAGLALREKYDLFSILKSGNIVPESPANASGYDVEDISQTIKNFTGSSNEPYIQCLKTKSAENGNDEYYLLAVELCLDKDLQPIACKTRRSLSVRLQDNAGPCPKNEPIRYLSAA